MRQSLKTVYKNKRDKQQANKTHFGLEGKNAFGTNSQKIGSAAFSSKNMLCLVSYSFDADPDPALKSQSGFGFREDLHDDPVRIRNQFSPKTNYFLTVIHGTFKN